ncbi:MAG TPA: M14 family zinc carboxypeptidase [Herpetosiphonaceae bacterium]
MRQVPGRWRRLVLVGVGVLIWCIAVISAVPQGTTAKSRLPESEAAAKVVRIKAVTEKESLALIDMGLDLLEMREGDDLFAIVSPAELKKLQQRGFDVRVDEAQTSLMQAQLDQLTVLGGYRTVEEGYSLLASAQSSYPNLAQVFTYGSSWDKVTAGGPAGYDLRGIVLTNKSRTGPKPPFVLISAIHAREMATAELSLRFINYLLSNYGTNADVTWLLDEHRVIVIPYVNPDGRKDAERGVYQRKNKDTVVAPCSSQTSSSQPGVDLNRNARFKWGTVDKPTQSKCAQTYPGPTAGSEPEVQAIESYLGTVFADQRGSGDTDAAPATAEGVFISLHSYSDLVLWPWGWTNSLAPNNTDLAGLGRKFATYNSYTAQKSTALYPTSGTTDDWTYGIFGVASYTFEVGGSSGSCGGFFPAFSCLDSGSNGNFWGRNLPAFLYAAKVARTPYQLHRGPDALSPATASVSGGYRVTATINDTKNGNQAISAAELYVDTPPWRGGSPVSLSATDGAFNSTAEAVQGTVSGLSSGKHIVFVRGRDAGGNWGPVSAVFLTVP